VVSFTPLPLYARERAPGTHFIGGWVKEKYSLGFGGAGEASSNLPYYFFPEVLV
jgi:hypothetical protein